MPCAARPAPRPPPAAPAAAGAAPRQRAGAAGAAAVAGGGADGGADGGAVRCGAGSMAPSGRLCAALLCGALSLCSLRAAPRQPDTLYMWIDAQQARVLIGKRGSLPPGRLPRRRVGVRSGSRRGCRPALSPHHTPPPLPFAGFEEDILIVSEGKMAPFTHDFRKAQQRMPAIPVSIHAMNFTWQATGRVGAETGWGTAL